MNPTKNNFLWNMGDQSRLPQFRAYVEKHFTKELYPDEGVRLRAIKGVIQKNNNYPQLNNLLMYHNGADEFLQKIYDHCSDPVNLCEEDPRANGPRPSTSPDPRAPTKRIK